MSWADPQDKQVAGFGSIKYWQGLAKILERGKLDGLFFADVPSVYDMYKNTTDVAIKYGVSWPAHDPVALIGIMAAATKHLGIATTVSAASLHPFLAVRALSIEGYCFSHLLQRGSHWHQGFQRGELQRAHQRLPIQQLNSHTFQSMFSFIKIF